MLTWNDFGYCLIAIFDNNNVEKINNYECLFINTHSWLKNFSFEILWGTSFKIGASGQPNDKMFY